MDAVDANAIADGTPAERAAANLVVQGLWTSWKPLVAGPPPPVLRAATVSAAILPALGKGPELSDGVAFQDAATTRVAGYLKAVALFEGEKNRAARFDSLSPQEIALATTLPVASVDRALGNIGAAIPPPGATTGNGGGDGGGTGVLGGGLAVLAAGALLLVGAVGAVAWCSGNEQCPVHFGGVPQVTDQATEPPATELATVEPPTTAPTEPPTQKPTRKPARTARPRVTPVPLVLPEPLDFGEVIIGQSPGLLPLTVTSPDDVELEFTFLENPEEAFAIDPECPWVPQLLGDYKCDAHLTFTPHSETTYVGRISVSVAGEKLGHPVDLSGSGKYLTFDYSPGSFDFSVVSTASAPPAQTLTVYSDRAAHVEFVVVSDGETPFSSDKSCELALDPSGSYLCHVAVMFTPVVAGPYFATLAIYTGAPEPREIPLTGAAETPSGID
jgi:hypothetical protein